MRNAPPTAPPAWIWAASLALALAVLASTLPAFVAEKSAEAHPATVMEQAIRRFAREAPPANALRVIAFGNSALATATLQLDEMADYARGRGLELDYLRLWRPWCQLHQVLGELVAAIDAGPDVVMIDSWALVYSLDRYSTEAYRSFRARGAADFAGGLQRIADQPSLLLEHQNFLFDRWTGATDQQMKLPLDPAPEQRKRGGDMRCDRAARRRTLLKAEVRYPDDGEATTVDPLVREALESLLRRAAARGVRIAFVDIPKAPSIEELPGVRKKRDATRELLHEIAARGAAVYIEYPGQIEEDDTCDLIHYSERGRDRYLPWFVDQLKALRAGGRAP